MNRNKLILIKPLTKEIKRNPPKMSIIYIFWLLIEYYNSK